MGIRHSAPGFRQSGQGFGPARNHVLNCLGEGPGPILHHRPAGFEMELGALGRSSDPEGLMLCGGAGGQMHGPLRQAEGVRMPLEDLKLLR